MCESKPSGYNGYCKITEAQNKIHNFMNDMEQYSWMNNINVLGVHETQVKDTVRNWQKATMSVDPQDDSINRTQQVDKP